MRKKTLYAVILTSLVLGCVVLVLLARDYRSRASESEQRLDGIDSILGSYQHRPLGLSCGVLSPALAGSILDGSVVMLQESGQRTYSFGESDELTAWSDICLYERSDTKSLYVQLYITTYESDDIARSELRSRIPVVNDLEVLVDSEAELTIYDAGVIYSANGREIIEVAAVNGKPAELKDYTVQTYKTIKDLLAAY